MKPEIIYTDKYIEIIGHYDDPVLCAKLTLLADLYAIEHKYGYAKFNIEDKDKLDFIDKKVEFVQLKKCYGLGLSTNIYLWKSSLDGQYMTYIVDIGIAASTDLLWIGYAGNDEIFYLSSSSTEYIPITNYKITEVLNTDTSEQVTTFTDTTFTLYSGSSTYVYIITVQPVTPAVTLKYLKINNHIITEDGFELFLTPNHPLYTIDGVFKTVDGEGSSQLKVGDTLVSYDGTKVVALIEPYTDVPIDMYNLDVKLIGQEQNEETDNYIANMIMAHNICLADDTEITLADGTVKLLKDMTIEDTVLAYNEQGELVEDIINKIGTGYTDEHTIYTFEEGYKFDVYCMHRAYNVEKQDMIDLATWEIGEHAITPDGKQVALLSVEKIIENEPQQYFHVYNTLGNHIANGLVSDSRLTFELHLGNKGE